MGKRFNKMMPNIRPIPARTKAVSPSPGFEKIPGDLAETCCSATDQAIPFGTSKLVIVPGSQGSSKIALILLISPI